MEIKYNAANEIELPVFANLDDNIDALESIFADWGDIVKKKMVLERKEGFLSVYIIYIDGLTDNEMVERTVTRPFLYEWKEESENRHIKADETIFRTLFHNQAEAIDLVEKKTMMDVIDGVLKGDTGIFVDGVEKAMLLSTKKLPTRAVNFPQKEAGLKGPRDSFLENFRINTALIRRRIKDPKMKLKQGFVG